MKVSKRLLMDTIGWGIILWLIGYLLGIVFFFVLPPTLIGWVIMPIGTIITLAILLTRIKNITYMYYVLIALCWTVIAILCDYFFLVKIFKPAGGYYKLDVYIYYIVTFMLPLLVGYIKTFKKSRRK